MVEKGLLEREIKRELGKNPWTELKLTDKCYLDEQSVHEIWPPPGTETCTQVALKHGHLNYKHNINSPEGVLAPICENERFSASVSRGSSQPKTRAPFIPPTTAEVQDYARQVGHTFLAAHPEKFTRHYEAAVPPWTKTNGKPVKNWKQTLLNWRDNGQDSAKPKKSLEWPDPPAEVIAEDFRRAREAVL